jgi:hypothetical protein
MKQNGSTEKRLGQDTVRQFSRSDLRNCKRRSSAETKTPKAAKKTLSKNGKTSFGRSLAGTRIRKKLRLARLDRRA